MPRIPSANRDFKRVIVPGKETGYTHPAERRIGNSAIPLAFQVTSPFNRTMVLFPHALVMHINPSSLSETHTQKKEIFQTRGGFVEQHWGHDLVELAGEGSTGAFMNIRTGLTSVLRQRTIAWDRYRDLHDLFKHNGSLYDPYGNIVLQGQIMLMFDRGTYLGTFRSFDVEESDDAPFVFSMNWSFKVEHTILSMSQDVSEDYLVPGFQGQNLPITTTLTGAELNPAQAQADGLAEQAERNNARRAAVQQSAQQAAIDKAADELAENDPLRGHDGELIVGAGQGQGGF